MHSFFLTISLSLFKCSVFSTNEKDGRANFFFPTFYRGYNPACINRCNKPSASCGFLPCGRSVSSPQAAYILRYYRTFVALTPDRKKMDARGCRILIIQDELRKASEKFGESISFNSRVFRYQLSVLLISILINFILRREIANLLLFLQVTDFGVFSIPRQT